ncbi:MAG: 6,7-dimethyl-8-ribityllumazine synthase [Proteobacteria bacterium]|jgi:6,7-dimethyl-8-ribityllumazine synthase|nr:6,7-dimethyl-8-ribityllumazine synthase [Alphaproteobacteria bacterium]NCC02482.1 6,7-dimethyl-8-ribityllumazine synthase [Pseudomonadota bacterium]
MEKAKKIKAFNIAEKPHVMIVQARFYDDIADNLLEGAKAVLDRVGATYEVITVPGSLEIPACIIYAVKSLDFDPVRRRFDGYVALGCVIKGETHHDVIVGETSAQGLQQIALEHTLAIGNGILTVNTLEQAQKRADPKQLDRGGAAAEACLSMIEIKQNFKLIPKRRWVGR